MNAMRTRPSEAVRRVPGPSPVPPSGGREHPGSALATAKGRGEPNGPARGSVPQPAIANGGQVIGPSGTTSSPGWREASHPRRQRHRYGLGNPTGGHRGSHRHVLDQDRPRWQDALRPVATNGRVVATSETYESKESYLKGVAAVKRLAADAVVVEEAAATSSGQRGRKVAPPPPAAASF